jgi:nitrate reductase NapD
MKPSGPSRRAFLEGQFAPRTLGPSGETMVHISSAIVSVLPARRDEILERLEALPDVEVHHKEAFKIVIVLEANEDGAIGSRLAEIACWSGVLSANMVFEQTERLSDMGD